MKRQRGVEREVSAGVKKEEILDRTTNEYEAIVAIAREARRLNSVPGVFLEKDEPAIPKAVENFVGGRVDYVVGGAGCREREPAGGRRKPAAKPKRKPARKATRKSSKKK